jgi:ABC-type polysaccharide/polyol phosphate export permease
LSTVPASKQPFGAPWVHRTPTRTWYGPLTDVHAPPLSTSVNLPWLLRSLHVLTVLTRYDFRGRYRAQALGVVWSLANPLVMMAIISLVFTRVFHSHIDNFPVFVLIGLLAWQWISSAVAAGTQSIVGNAELIKRTVFAREALPTAAVLSYGINYCLESLVLVAFAMLFPGSLRLSSALVIVPVLLALLALLLVGVTLATSVLNVVYRDVAYIVSTGTSILYWLTPVFYPTDVIPQPYRTVLEWNPAGAILVGLRGVLMRGEWPAARAWAMMTLPTLAVLAVGWLVFEAYERMALDHV